MASESLPPPTPTQLHALLDILTHAETYREVELFRDPAACTKYGYPFSNDGSDTPAPVAAASACPIQQLLLKRLVLTLPPVRALPPQFWTLRMQGLLTRFAEADLSDSYEKGAMGTRKTLATGASTIIALASRGCLGGCPGGPVEDLKSRAYDRGNAAQLARAWEDTVRDSVYGNLVGELFDFAAQNENLEDHSPAIQASVDWIILQLAGFMHQICVVSPDGPYLMRLVANLHKLAPYSLVRKTLRVGNAATMIHGLMKLLLTKMSVGGITNFIGLTKNADDGMNLLQRILSMVLHWDTSDFRKFTEAIDKAEDGPPEECLSVIRDHLLLTHVEREAARNTSMQQQESIVTTILNTKNPKLAEDLSEEHHSLCMEYYSVQLSIRDRDEITNIMCRHHPDFFTQMWKDALAAVDPLLRELHENIDLREHISDAEVFVGHFIKVARGTEGTGAEYTPPGIKDFVRLLHESKPLLYKWLHRVASQTPVLRDKFRDWAAEAIKTFQNPRSGVAVANDISTAGSGAGRLNGPLGKFLASLDPETHTALCQILDAHASYLETMGKRSIQRIQIILDDLNEENSDCSAPETVHEGPGLYLARWQHLMDETIITPETAHGPARKGRDVKGATTQGKPGTGPSTRSKQSGRRSRAASPSSPIDRVARPQNESGLLPAPDTRLVVERLGEMFRDLVDVRARAA